MPIQFSRSLGNISEIAGSEGGLDGRALVGFGVKVSNHFNWAAVIQGGELK